MKSTSTRWRASNNGTYHVYMRANQVSDTNGQFVVGAVLGYFKVRIA